MTILATTAAPTSTTPSYINSGGTGGFRGTGGFYGTGGFIGGFFPTGPYRYTTLPPWLFGGPFP